MKPKLTFMSAQCHTRFQNTELWLLLRLDKNVAARAASSAAGEVADVSVIVTRAQTKLVYTGGCTCCRLAQQGVDLAVDDEGRQALHPPAPRLCACTNSVGCGGGGTAARACGGDFKPVTVTRKRATKLQEGEG